MKNLSQLPTASDVRRIRDPWGGMESTNGAPVSDPARSSVPGGFIAAVLFCMGMLAFAGRTAAQDTSPPFMTQLIPPAGATVRVLGSVEVFFNEYVTGVKAEDLLINGQPAEVVNTYGLAHYLFEFAQPATGVVHFAWSTTHAIRDFSSNRFPGGSWTMTLDPRFGVPNVLISEFMASNTHTTNDVDGEFSDWIELLNAGSVPVNLDGWFLADSTNDLTKWRFPGVVLLPNAYLLVWASGKDRTNATAQLHTNFKLNKGGEYLALLDPETNVVSDFAPQYPPQESDASYGRDPSDPALTGFYITPTPGRRNATGGLGSFAPDVVFSTNSGTFVQPFGLALTLKTPSSNAVIRYTLGTAAPASNSTLYTGPITITGTAQVRARAFAPGLFPGDIHSEQYIQIQSDVRAFTSDLPLMILHNNGGGSVPSSADQFVMVQTFEPVNGVSSLTNQPNDRAHGIFHLRGSSTLSYPKGSFFLETQDEFGNDQGETLLGLPKQSDWVLYAPNDFEPVLIHNPTAYELSRQMGRYASHTRFVVVFLKDDRTAGLPITTSDYNGIYVLEEKVKIDHDRVDIAKLQPDDIALPDVTGGYLLSVDRSSPGEQPFTAGGQKVNFVDPHYAEITLPQRDAQQQYIVGYFNQFATALNSAGYTDPVSGYPAYVDVDSWVDYHIHVVSSFCVDAMFFSTYLYKPRNGKICFGPVWDFDRAEGSTDGRDFSPIGWRGGCGNKSGNFFGAAWWSRIFTDPDFWQRWIDRYQVHRQNALATTNVFQIIDTFAGQVRQEQPREQAKWGVRPRSGSASRCAFSYNFGLGGYQAEVDWMKVWYSNRLDFIDGELEGAPIFNRPAGRITSGSTVTLTGPAGAGIYYTLDGSDPRAPGGAIAANARLYTGPIVLTNNVRVVARSRDLNHLNLTGGVNPPISSPWSGPIAATFYTQLPPLLITEIMYHPQKPPLPSLLDPDEFEFIELENVGSTALNLAGIRFTNGIDFTFASSNAITSLAPGGYAVLVKNLAAFTSRYPGVSNIAGQYTGNLDNHGEHLYLEGALGEPILDFTYDDSWFPPTDGDGFSLVLVDENQRPANWMDPAAWRASRAFHGSPGRPDAAPTLQAARTGHNVRFFWPLSASGYSLFTATNLIPPIAWKPVTNGLMNTGGVFSLTLPASAAGQFFQLRAP